MKRINKMLRRISFSAAPLLLPLLGVPAPAFGQASPSDFTTGYRFDPAGRLTGTISPDPDGSGPLRHAAVRYTYNAAGQVVSAEKGELSSWQDETIAPALWAGFTVLNTATTIYDSSARKSQETLSASGVAQTVAQYSYDSSGRLECAAVRMNPAVFNSLPSSACTLGTQGSQGPDRITRNIYDASGQLLKVQKAYGTSLQQDYATYEYTQNGKQKAVIDANGNRAEMTYDGLDRQARWVFPSPSGGGAANQGDYEQYGYDANGNRTSLRKRDGVTLTYAYDGLNRMTQKAVPASATFAAGYTVNYGYDLRGLQLSATFAATGQGVSNSYDSFGRLTSQTTNMGGVSRTISHNYDADGNRTSVTHPDGHYFPYVYDELDRMTSVGEDGIATLATISYDAAGRHLGTGYAGASSSYGYDGVGRLSNLAYDLAGASADQSLTFGYNAASQIVARTASNDAFASNTAYNVSRAYSVNGLNQYTAAGPAAFAYDANGNLTSDGTNAYVYDAENRLVSRSGGVALAYDPNGRLWQTSGGSAGATQFLYDGDELIGEYNSNGTLTHRYVQGNGEDDPLIWYDYAAGGYRRGLFTDHQGSIVATSDSSGNPFAINAYDAWGIPNAANQGRFGYTGQAWLPELGMWYYKARIYSPTLGRFLQTDPIGYKDQVNLYAYVGNDPTDGRDPSGLQGLLPATEGDPQYIADKKKEIREGITDSLWAAGKRVWWYTADLVSIPIGGPEEIGEWVAVNEGMSLAARAFQASQGGRNGMAYAVSGIKFDGHLPGKLIEVKSNFDKFIGANGRFYPWFRGSQQFLDQARRQLAAAAGRAKVEWRVEGTRTAAAIRQEFKDNHIIDIIVKTIGPVR